MNIPSVRLSVGSQGRTHPRFTALPPLALYVHLPWCIRKCPYCDFNSHEVRESVPQSQYTDALVADLDSALPLVWGRRVYSVFFGGGTPSLFDADSIAMILSAIRARLPLAADAEITLEANPGTAEAAKFAGYRGGGVNRLSIGVQSFDAKHLKALGRIHDDRQAHRAIEIGAEHFDNFNIDLMYALPGQTPAEAASDVDVAITYRAPHVSAYHLTIEPNTYFHRYPPAIPDEDTAALIHEEVVQRLAGSGYDHYETSAHAQPGRRSRHNLNYWLFGDYLGIGAGAHSKLTFADRVLRQVRYRQPREYMARAISGSGIQADTPVAAGELPFEFMMNALRLNGGFRTALFEERTGLPLTTVLPQLDEAERRGLISRDHERVTPTELGQRFLNDLLQIFLPQGSALSAAAYDMPR